VGPWRQQSACRDFLIAGREPEANGKLQERWKDRWLVRGSEAFGPQNQSLKASAETESGSVLGGMQFVVRSFAPFRCHILGHTTIKKGLAYKHSLQFTHASKFKLEHYAPLTWGLDNWSKLFALVRSQLLWQFFDHTNLYISNSGANFQNCKTSVVEIQGLNSDRYHTSVVRAESWKRWTNSMPNQTIMSFLSSRVFRSVFRPSRFSVHMCRHHALTNPDATILASREPRLTDGEMANGICSAV
jgi:hypothetical protein